MSVHKVILRCPFTKRQRVKKIYESDVKFEKFGKKYAEMGSFKNDVEVYKMIDENYVLQYTLKMPRTNEEIEDFVVKHNMYKNETVWRIKDLEKEKKHFKEVHNKELTE